MKNKCLLYKDNSEIYLGDKITWKTCSNEIAIGIIDKDQYDNWCIRDVILNGESCKSGFPWHILHVQYATKIQENV